MSQILDDGNKTDDVASAVGGEMMDDITGDIGSSSIDDITSGVGSAAIIDIASDVRGATIDDVTSGIGSVAIDDDVIADGDADGIDDNVDASHEIPAAKDNDITDVNVIPTDVNVIPTDDVAAAADDVVTTAPEIINNNSNNNNNNDDTLDGASCVTDPKPAAPIKRPREVVLAREEHDEQIVEILNSAFMEDPLSSFFWPDPVVRANGHRAMFYAALANQRIGSPDAGTFVNVVIDTSDGDQKGRVKAASIWTTPESFKGSLNNYYYGLKYLGVFETYKWIRSYTKDLHDFISELFAEMARIRRNDDDEGSGGGDGGKDGGGDGAGGDGEGGEGEGGGIVLDGVEFGGDFEFAWPDFIGADAEIRGQGYGTDIMRDALRRTKEAGKTVFILSSNQKNLTFYQKHGFEVLVQKDFHGVLLTGLAPKLTAMTS